MFIHEAKEGKDAINFHLSIESDEWKEWLSANEKRDRIQS